MPKHLADLYQASIKENGKEIEMNFINRNELDLTYYDTNFFGGFSEKTDYLMHDENTVIKSKLTKISFCYYIYYILLFIIFISCI